MSTDDRVFGFHPSSLGEAPQNGDALALGTTRVTKSAAPRWEVRAKDRLRGVLKELRAPLQEFAARDANESDTRLIVTDLLSRGLGYDTYRDITTEYQVRGTAVDYGLKIDGELVAFIEVKKIGTRLNGKSHLSQVLSYATQQGVEWAILTNGRQWHVYRLTKSFPTNITKVIEVDLMDESTPLASKVNSMFAISREGMARGVLDDFYEEQAVNAPDLIAQVLVSEEVLKVVRREIRKVSQPSKIPALSAVRDVLVNDVIRDGLLDK